MYGESKDPCGRWGKLVKAFTTTTHALGGFHWTKVDGASEGFTFT